MMIMLLVVMVMVMVIIAALLTCLPSMGSVCMGDTLMGSIIGGSGSPEEENLFAGQPYFDLFKCRSMSQRREKAWDEEELNLDPNKLSSACSFLSRILPCHRRGTCESLCVCVGGAEGCPGA